tara:strand:- start:813 stop:1397 length:585 start_codon:yes stop_codon:yes gene_type:complete
METTTHTKQVERARAILGLISPLKRLDKSIGIGNLALEAGVSLAAFEEALQVSRHPRDGQHVYFGMKAVKAAVKELQRQELAARIDEHTQALEALLKSAGRSLRDIATPRAVQAPKTSGKLSFRFTQAEAQTMAHALSLTGKPNTSAQVKACVEAYPRLHDMEQSYTALTKELQELKESVSQLPSLILSLAAKQ